MAGILETGILADIKAQGVLPFAQTKFALIKEQGIIPFVQTRVTSLRENVGLGGKLGRTKSLGLPEIPGLTKSFGDVGLGPQLNERKIKTY